MDISTNNGTEMTGIASTHTSSTACQRIPPDSRPVPPHTTSPTMRPATGEPGDSLEERRKLLDDVTHSIDAAADYWATRKEEFLWLAGELYLGFVDPAMFYGEEPFFEQDMFNLLFTEWTLFEFPFYKGLTPLQEYAAHPPVDASPQDVRWMREVMDAQFFSRFEIRHKEPASGMTTLVDVCTSKRYDVFDEVLCNVDRWKSGTIAMRIARVGDLWLHVGKVHLYDRAEAHFTAVDGPGAFHPEDRINKPWAEQAGFYLRLIRDLIGLDGRYRATTKLVSTEWSDR
ncbi:hypothetical protein [Collinsella sp. An2]|uniref:hypothetical protein n=1 Tax=Collinsella sp. An2 TaxID=1965585 RepID=UPI000B569B08|nr:hypothetical protein [Collinsella sp. An2]OUP09211.1 hypothetical protein B5F33_05625 [Collinsella sp. An2]